MCNLKNKTNKTKLKQTHRDRKQTAGYQRRGRWGRGEIDEGD